MLLVFVDGREVDRPETLYTRGEAFEFFLPGTLAGLGRQGGEHPVQVVAILVQLVLEGLAAHGQGLPFEALLLQLATQQLRLLLGLGAALLGVAQLAIGIFQGQASLLELFLHAQTLVQQLLQLQAQLFQRCGALLQVQAELFAALVEALELQGQALQGLTRRIVLRPQRADAHGQLMGMVLVLAGFLADAVEALAQAVAFGQQLFALLGVAGHGVQGVLQGQATLAQLLKLDGALLFQLAKFFLQTTAAQGQLLDLGLLGGQPGLQLAEAAGLVLQQAALLFTSFFLLALAVA
ncbi:hypothetical protein D3C72_1315500 [compost metagenome]